jgi:hypothetical protein
VHHKHVARAVVRTAHRTILARALSSSMGLPQLRQKVASDVNGGQVVLQWLM